MDPVTFEVIRHRLLEITNEQAARLSAISGSKNVTEISDFNVGIYLPDGNVAVMGRTILFHASSMAAVVGHVIEDCTKDPGIEPGDMFVVNSPWKGTIHGPDMAIVAPIFFDGELIFWSGGMMHMQDIGGMREGGLGLDTTECYQEGLLLPPTKLISNGKLRSDVWNIILGHSRAAQAMALDLKGLIASNHAAIEGLEKVTRKYGPKTLMGVMQHLVEMSELRMRRRLAELPDASTSAVGYFEVNRLLNTAAHVSVELTKEGDTLTLDYSGSSPQMPDSSNCTWAGLMAGISAAVLPTLAFDIPWNAGLYRPIKVICPEGLVCNANKPAAVSSNITGSIWEVQLATISAVSKLLACSNKYLAEAEASPAPRPGTFAFFGVNQHGERFSGWRYEVLASGGGAYPDHDGVSTQGHHDIERLNISNVEALELDLPMLYLWRGLAADSGGVGRYRGGQSIGMLCQPHKAERFMAGFGERHEMPDGWGMCGGYPPGEDDMLVVRDSRISEVYAAGHIPDLDELGGQVVALSDLPHLVPLMPGDAVWSSSAGGGGWGDPLERQPHELQRDLDLGAVTVEGCVRLYGAVVGADGRIDEEATKQHRLVALDARRNWQRIDEPTHMPVGELKVASPLGGRMEVVADGNQTFWVRCRCGHILCRAEENWRHFDGREIAEPANISLELRVPPAMEIRRYCCPGCGVLHAVDLCVHDAPEPSDVRLSLTSLRGTAN